MHETPAASPKGAVRGRRQVPALERRAVGLAWAGTALLVGSLGLGCSDDPSREGAGGGSSTPGPDEALMHSPGGTAFYIDRTEVTRNAYAQWLATSPSTTGQLSECSDNDDFTPQHRWPPGERGEHPVVGVDWCDAYTYCQAQGKRLCGRIGGGPNDYHDYRDPELDQWYSACSSGGVDEYPYGSPFDPHACNGGLHGRGTTAPIRTMPQCHTDDDLWDMSGNVREWKDACEHDTESVAFNYCRLGGGSFRDGELRHLSCNSPGQDAFRTGHWDSIGFRCCREARQLDPVGTGGSAGAVADGCNECLSSSCAVEDDACLANEGCILIIDCVGRCFDSVCVADCEGAEPAGVDAFRALDSCFEDSCSAACG